jgi:putative aldouronate transport system substrate-binding protein
MTAEELLLAAGLPLPGAPDNPKGWKITFPALPEGMPLNPPVTITGSRRVDSTVTFPEGKGVDNNLFTDYMKTLLGIEWKAAWTWIAAEDGDQKYNLGMAANDLPDLCENVTGTILVKMYEADLVEDITESFDNLASEEWIKAKWAPYGNLPWAYASYQGRKKGWPYVERAYQNDKVMWMRQDWLDKLGLAAPTTIEELYAVATAFKSAGLGQGAAGSTLGIAAQQELGYSWYGSFDPIIGSIAGTLPGYWTEDASGMLQNGSVDPRMKNALETLALWYKEGLIPADFPTRPTAEAQKLVAGNQVGIHFTPAWDSGWGCAESKKNDPTAVWKPYDIPAGAEGKKKHWSNPFVGVVSPIRKGMPYVDAFIKQNNFNAEWGENPEYRCFNNPAFEGLTFNIVDGKVVTESMSYMKWGFGPIGGTGGGGVDPARDDTNLRYQLSWKDIPEDQRDAAQATFFDDPTGASTLYQEAALLVADVSEAEGIKNMFNSLPTTTMVELGTDLGTSGGENNRLGSLATETLTAIITGQKPLDAFDEFVSTWKSLGGDQITAEVNDWYATQK